MSDKLLLAYHPAFLEHDAGPGHPEYPERIEAILGAIEAASWADQVIRLEARLALPEEVALVHNPKYIEAMRRICEKGGEFIPRMEAAVGEASWEAALRSVGAGMTLADAIMGNLEFRVKNLESPEETQSRDKTDLLGIDHSKFITLNSKLGFAPTRPPGHHATYERPMGFCIFNNIAILARYLQTRHNIGKVAIVDFDVHHGNGTEEAFWKDPTVYYVSLHTDDSYPYNSGRREDSGEGEGRGFTLNVPLPTGTRDRDYLAAFDRYVIPKLEEFAPEFLLVSAGFDAHYCDTLGKLKLTDAAYAGLGMRLKSIANRLCNGRLISLLEGGYDLQALASSVTAYLSQMLIDGES